MDMDLNELKQNGAGIQGGETLCTSAGEVWVPINGYDRYYVSNLGRVKSASLEIKVKRGQQEYNLPINGRVLIPIKHRNGYVVVGLNNGNGTKIKSIHRLVATAFIHNPENKPTVNHKNGIKDDNRVENLEWATYSENVKHGYDVLGVTPSKHALGKFGKLCKHSRPVVQMDLSMNEIKVWDCMADAEREMGFNRAMVHRCCNNIKLNGYGFKWKYLNKK